ncbi:hypothetical protein LTR08_008971 [Meristemomyces frigidus]|nr:hypothetical protein LTR08_008971 [Meristemomyces frigidus]
MAPSTRKRKRSLSTLPASSLAVFATQLKQNPDELSIILDLPPELRNHIYLMVLEDTDLCLSHLRHKKALATKSPLPRLNKQIHNEFFNVASLAGSISTSAFDFDFRHIVAFLNRLSDAELRVLPGVNTPAERCIKVDLTMTLDCSEEPPLLQRWINRAGHPTKKGTNLNFQYKLVDGEPTVAIHFFVGGQINVLSQPKFPKWRSNYSKLVDGRPKEEWGKILTAIGY